MHPNGTLIDGFYLFKSTGASADRGTSIAAIRSTDKGATWSKKAIDIAPAHSIGETDPEPINCRPFITGNPPCTLVRSDGVILDLAVDYTSGPHAGRIYVTWQDHQDNPFGDDLILLSHSDDAGLTWSAPAKVNQTPTGTFTDQAWEPAVHVNSDGVVAVSYYDFRNDVSGDRRLTTDHWIVHSHDGGATWSESHLGGPFDLHQAPYARGYFIGDYQGLDSQGSAFRAAVHARAAPAATRSSRTPTRPTSSPTARSDPRRPGVRLWAPGLCGRLGIGSGRMTSARPDAGRTDRHQRALSRFLSRLSHKSETAARRCRIFQPRRDVAGGADINVARRRWGPGSSVIALEFSPTPPTYATASTNCERAVRGWADDRVASGSGREWGRGSGTSCSSAAAARAVPGPNSCSHRGSRRGTLRLARTRARPAPPSCPALRATRLSA